MAMILGGNMPNAQIISVSATMAPNKQSINDVAARIIENSPATNIPVKYIEKLTGVQTVYHRNEGQNTSDFAAENARIALERAGLTIRDIDLLIFASASQDLIEPATSHIVSNILGGNNLPVFDVKNACNSFLNGVQVANSFIKSGTYRRILICSGETPSMAIRWANKDKQQFLDSFAGFSMSDGGAAMILQATDETGRGVIDLQFTAASDRWNVGTLGAGGSRHPRDIDATYFNMDGRELAESFLALGPGILNRTLNANSLEWSDFEVIGMHQVSATYLPRICRTLDVPRGQLVETIQSHGNVTSLSLPLQLQLAMERGRLAAGDLFAFIGFAGGISTGMGVFRI
jgi:3-oxoacyl-(acyl-carrier-protein) synthase III